MVLMWVQRYMEWQLSHFLSWNPLPPHTAEDAVCVPLRCPWLWKTAENVLESKAVQWKSYNSHKFQPPVTTKTLQHLHELHFFQVPLNSPFNHRIKLLQHANSNIIWTSACLSLLLYPSSDPIYFKSIAADPNKWNVCPSLKSQLRS